MIAENGRQRPMGSRATDAPIGVLLVEDNPGDARLMREVLADEGRGCFVLECVERLDEAIEFLETRNPDIVFLDLSLPDSTGLESFVAVQQRAQHVPIVVLTGLADEAVGSQAVRLGAQDYLVKGQADGPLLVHAARYAIERKEAERALRRSELEYRRLVEQAVYGIHRVSENGALLMVNPALVQMLRYENESLLLDVNLANDVFVEPDAFFRLVETCRTEGSVRGSEAEWKCGDGQLITVRISARTVDGVDGRDGEHLEMMAEDITEHRALEAQLRQAQRLEAVGQLTGGIAHDFNNLLTVIMANADLASDCLPGSATDAKEMVDEVRDAAQRGGVLVKKLLGFAGNDDLDIKSIRLDNLIRDFLVTMRRVLPENIEIREPTVQPELALISGDPVAIERMVLNLVTNARDAMPDGGTLTIEVSDKSTEDQEQTEQPGNEWQHFVCLTVTDSGEGMDADTKARIFEPFFTTKPPGKGSGLGMAMIYGLVKQHAGHVFIDSEVDKGTTIRILFPAATGVAISEKQDEEALPAHRGRGQTILVVEDEQAVRRAAQHALGAMGYKVLVAREGEEALQIVLSGPEKIDLILSDVVMPKMGGVEMYNELRRRGRYPKVLFMSGYTKRQGGDRARLPSGVRLLDKPWTVVGLLGAVQRCLSESATLLEATVDG